MQKQKKQKIVSESKKPWRFQVKNYSAKSFRSIFIHIFIDLLHLDLLLERMKINKKEKTERGRRRKRRDGKQNLVDRLVLIQKSLRGLLQRKNPRRK